MEVIHYLLTISITIMETTQKNAKEVPMSLIVDIDKDKHLEEDTLTYNAILVVISNFTLYFV